MIGRYIVIFSLPFMVFGNEQQLIDIKPIYSQYNYKLIIPLIIILTFFIIYSIKKVLTFIKTRTKEKDYVEYNWSLLLKSIREDENINSKEMESQLAHLIKLYLERKTGEKFTCQVDEDLITRLKNNKNISSDHFDLIEEFFNGSTNFRFDNKSFSREIIIDRCDKVKIIFDKFEESQKEGM